MTFSTTRRVEFRDTDAAGIVHFSAFFPMMEAAEHEMLRSLGISIMPREEDAEPTVTWPRVAASCEYTAAARFDDSLQISVRVAKIGTSSVQYNFRFLRDQQLIAKGSVTARLLPALARWRPGKRTHSRRHSRAVGETSVMANHLPSRCVADLSGPHLDSTERFDRAIHSRGCCIQFWSADREKQPEPSLPVLI